MLFERLEPALAWNGKEQSYAEIAQNLGMTADAVAQSVKRMRSRYRKLLELEIGETVDGPEAVAGGACLPDSYSFWGLIISPRQFSPPRAKQPWTTPLPP